MVNRKQNLWILYGSDPVYMDMRKKELLHRYFKGEPPDPVVFDGTGTYQEFCDQIEGQSLFSAATAVILENPFFLTKGIRDEKGFAQFLQTLENAPDDVFVVMVAETKLDKRLKPVKQLLALCSSLECSFLKPADGVGYMEFTLRGQGKKMDPAGRAWLESALSSWSEISRPFLQTECDKIVLMTGDSPAVTKEILQEALPDYMDKGIFRFIDKLLDRDASAVLADAGHVFTDAAATLKNLGALSALFRRILMWREMKEARFSPSHIAEALGLRSSWQAKQLERQAQKVSRAEAEQFLLDLFRYQMELRGRGGSSRTLEEVLLRFCMRKSDQS